MTSKARLDAIYRKYNRREYVSPDPLQFLYDFPDLRDREIVGLVASSLAYGRVSQILKSVKDVLDRIGPTPYTFLDRHATEDISRACAGFKHRFTAGEDVASLLIGAKRLIGEYASLGECFIHGLQSSDETALPALAIFVDKFNCPDNYLLPSPHRGSACKRLNLFLRWMVRNDAVDPGGWQDVGTEKLIVPVDTHMAKIGRMLKLTSRKSADMKMALELTAAFRKLVPQDPVKYDFALTRFGIRTELDISQLSR